MYLHIGKDIIVKSEDIIAIFDYEKVIQNNIFKQFYENIEKNIEIIDENKKTLVLIEKSGKIKGYISNISSTTIANRKTKLIYKK